MSIVADDGLLSAGEGVPVGPCPACEREVVAYLGEPESSRQTYACVHCDGPVRGVELRAETELARLGYSVSDPLAAGCGTGCGAGGCAPRGRSLDEVLAAYRKG